MTETTKQIPNRNKVEKMMPERKEAERKNQPGFLLSQLRQICTNLGIGMERSGIDADLKQEVNAKVGI